MLWHIVKFRFAHDTDEHDRVTFEEALTALADEIVEIRLLRVGRSVDEPHVTGLITGFDDTHALATYRDHPQHVPVVARAKELCEEITRLDIETPDPTDALPRVR